jgi:hypothetical protein
LPSLFGMGNSSAVYRTGPTQRWGKIPVTDKSVYRELDKQAAIMSNFLKKLMI